MARGQSVIRGEREFVCIGDGTRYHRPGNRVGTVQHNDLDSGLSCGFEEVAHRGLVCIEAHASILYIDDYCVELFELLYRRTPLRIGIAVDAVHGNSARSIGRVPDLGGIELSQRAVFWTEQRSNLHARNGVEDINGAAACSVDSRLVRDNADLSRSCIALRWFERVKVVGLEDIDSVQHSAIAVSHPTASSAGFVVTSDCEQRIFVVNLLAEIQRLGNYICNLAAQTNDTARSVGVHRVSE